MGSNSSSRTLYKGWGRYAFALSAGLAALVVSIWLNPLGGNQVGYLLMLPAVAFSAWYCGVGPSILVIVLAASAGMYGFTPRIHPFTYLNAQEAVNMFVFMLSSAFVITLGELRRRQNEELQKSRRELEAAVRERTADLDAVNRNLRELSARLLQLQDDERRRIARELHDSVGQMLAALSMNLTTVRTDIEHLAKTAAALTDSEGLVHDMVTEVRTISHLLHPPLLDELGLSSALRWYVDGFSQRSKIKVDLDLPKDFGRLPSDIETAVFRVVQECLTNIHRHSGSQVAKIHVRNRDHQVRVEIEDKGKGIPEAKLQAMASTGTPGVGVRGMQERLRQLRGTLEIQSNSGGTRVTVQIPAAEASGPTVSDDRPSPAAA